LHVNSFKIICRVTLPALAAPGRSNRTFYQYQWPDVLPGETPD
jgi:hypothetical protein